MEVPLENQASSEWGEYLYIMKFLIIVSTKCAVFILNKAVANLVQVSITNLNRLEVIWRLVTGHLLEVCQHTNMHFRKVGAEGISHLITSAFAEDSIFSNQRRQEMVLAAFSEMSTIPKIDVRTRQMQCVLEVLESRGEKLTSAWPVLLEIIQASCEALKDQGIV